MGSLRRPAGEMAVREKGQNANYVGMCQRALELAEVGVFRGKTTHSPIRRIHIDSLIFPRWKGKIWLPCSFIDEKR